MNYKVLLLIFILITRLLAAEAPLIKEKITPQNLQTIHAKISGEIYDDVLRRIENPRRTASPQSPELQKKSLDIAYLINIVACGHNPTEAEHSWSLHKGTITMSNMYLAIAYVEKFITYDYTDVIEDITMPNQVKSLSQPAIVFKEGIGISISPSQIVARNIMKNMKIDIQKTTHEDTKVGCCIVS